MKEQTRTRVLVVLALVLLLAVGAQGYQLYTLQHQMAQLTGANEADGAESFQLAPPNAADPLFQTLPADPTNWDPFQEMSRMQQRIDAMFNNAFGRFGQSSLFGPHVSGFAFSPRMDLVEKDDKYVMRLEIPGSDHANIEATVEGQQLTVKAETTSTTEQEPGSKMLRQERHVGKFSRTITLPDNADPATLETEYKDGVYTINIKKKS